MGAEQLDNETLRWLAAAYFNSPVPGRASYVKQLNGLTDVQEHFINFLDDAQYLALKHQ